MKQLIFILLPLFTFGQSETIWHDLTNVIENERGGWSVGNACGKDYKLNAIHKGDLDMKGDDLEILNSHLIIEGDVLNAGTIIYLCDNSVLEIKGGTLDVTELEKQSLKIFPNPTVNEINIKGIEVFDLAIFDMQGRKLKHFKTFGMLHKIMINDLESGVYVLVINENITRKIVKR